MTVAAEPLGHLDQDLRLAGRAILLRLDQLVEGADAGLGLGLARLGRAADPFELVVDRLLLALLLALLLLQPLGLLLQIAGIIGFVDVIAAAIELEHPVHDIVEEVAVVGDEDDVAGIIDRDAFPAIATLSASRWLVGSSSSRMSGFSSSSRVSATRRFSPPDRLVDRAVAGRAAQRVHRDFELVVERPAVDRVDLLLKLAHLGHQRVEIGILGRIGHHRARSR